MKKFLVIAAGLIVCLALVGPAYAIDRSSLESQTTEGLYDRNDPFDHAMEPGLMYQLERWRLYTNLSAYEGDVDLYDEDFDDFDTNREAYLIGVSGKLGPGSVAVLYETQKYEYNWEDNYRFVLHDEDEASPAYFDPATPSFDGYPDVVANVYGRDSEESKETEDNWYLGYGMDFGDISLGVSYAPEFWKWEGTVGLGGVYFYPYSAYSDIPGVGDWDTAESGYDFGAWWEDMGWDHNGWGAGNNYHGDFDSINLNINNDDWGLPRVWVWQDTGRDLNRICDNFYDMENSRFHGFFYTSDPSDPQTWERWESDVQMAGSGEEEEKVHPINLQSHIRTIPNWDFLVGVGYADIQREDKFDMRFLNWGTYQNSAGDYSDFSSAMSARGAFWRDTDADEWSVYVSPTYQVNDIVSIRTDFRYNTLDGDFNNGCSGTFQSSETYTDVTNADPTQPYETEVWRLDGVWDGSSDGDVDGDSYAIEPRVYFDYDRVKFSLGVGYMKSNYEESGAQKRFYSYAMSYNDGDTEPFDSDDWTEQGKWTGRVMFKEEYDVTTWRLPVAAEWMATDKLTFRAGAAYYRVDWEEKEKRTEYMEEWESMYRIDGAGNYDDIYPEEQVTTDPYEPGTTYDDNTKVQYESHKRDGTDDFTRYQLGLGWLFTENLQFDLMWSGKGPDGGVDMQDVFASITLAF